MTMEGGCFCGAVRYRIDGEPRRVTHCHCVHCRRTSGAAFVTWAEVEPSQFSLLQGEPGECSTRPGVTRRFCTGCGTQLTFQDVDDPGSLDVSAASLDTPEAIEPDDHVWCDRILPWIRLDDGLPRFHLSRRHEEGLVE